MEILLIIIRKLMTMTVFAWLLIVYKSSLYLRYATLLPCIYCAIMHLLEILLAHCKSKAILMELRVWRRGHVRKRKEKETESWRNHVLLPAGCHLSIGYCQICKDIILKIWLSWWHVWKIILKIIQE